MKKKLVFFNTHPVQYFAPMYSKIRQNGFFDLEVWYGTKHGLNGEIDKQFSTNVRWDIPVLDGYTYKFLNNFSLFPGIYNGFFGVVNFGIWKELRKLPNKSIIVVHGWTPFSAIFTLICSKLLGHTTCLRAESPLIHENSRTKKALFLRKLFFKYFLFKIIDRFLFIGEQNRLFYKYYGVGDSKLIFIPYSVNNEYFQSESERLLPLKNEIKSKLNIPVGHQIILFSGKFIEKKRPLDLLNAYNLLKNKDDITLVFMGEGELRKDLEEEIRIKNLSNVILTGFVNQSKISEYYSIADIFVMCSDYGETWGLATNEIMNFSVPILISDRTGNFSDLVRGNGNIFKTTDISDLSMKLESLLSLTEFEIKKLGEKSLQIIRQFDFKIIIDNLQSIN